MKGVISILFFLPVLSGCENQVDSKLPEMEKEARNTVLEYLKKNNLPSEGLQPFKSSAQPTPDFGYLYKGGGRCIEFIINCNGQSCKELNKYPYDEHGDPCP